MKELIQLNIKDISYTRDKILKEQNNLCALCKTTIDDKSGYSLDHQHRLKTSKIGEDGGGLIRGVLCRPCNVTDGRIWNSTQRFLLAKTVQDRITWLESLIEYYKKENYPLIHPSEKTKEKKVSKRNYNKLKRLYNNEEFIPKRKNQKKKEFPEYPKSSKLTKSLAELFNRFKVSPWN